MGSNYSRIKCDRRLPDRLRKEIRQRRLSQYRIAIETGIKQPSLSRFVNGGSLKLLTAALLLDYLGYELAAKSNKRRQCKS